MLSKAATTYKSACRLTSLATRSAGGGPKKPTIPATQTDFDLVIVGGMNAAALTKFL